MNVLISCFLASLILVTLSVLCILSLRWQHRYYIGDSFIEKVMYTDRSIFKRALRKIYRPKKYSDMDYDIFVLRKVDHFRKIREYYLVNIDDEAELTASFKGKIQ